MSKAFDILKEYGVFFLATVNDGKPAVRPFGAVMEYNDKLYVATANFKDVYNQLKKEKNVELAAWKSGTMDWIRIQGIAEEDTSLAIKERILNECPVLADIFKSADNEVLAVFSITVDKAYAFSLDGVSEL